MGKPIIMGRKTFESVGKPLPGRTNIVITRNKDYQAPGCLMAASVKQALELVNKGKADPDPLKDNEVFIAGGGEIYKQAMPLADRMYITIIDHDFVGDTFFPRFSASDWLLAEEIYHPADEKNKYPMLFRTYERK